MDTQQLLANRALVYQGARRARGGWLIVLAAAIFTIGTLILLPMADVFTPTPKATPMETSPVSTMRLPSPPPVLDPAIAPEPPPPTPSPILPPPPQPPPPEVPRPPTTPLPIVLELLPPKLKPVADLNFQVAAVPQPPAPQPTPQPQPPAPEPVRQQAAPPAPPASPPVYGADEVDQMPRPTYSPRPPYPMTAQRRRIEGYAEAHFTVTSDGQVTDVRIVESRPAGVFETTTRDGLSHWRFEPATRDGLPVSVRVQMRIRYQLD